MSSIHIPETTIQVPAKATHRDIWSVIADHNLHTYRELAPQVINVALEEERDTLLQRGRYVRRPSTEAQPVAARCNRCGSTNRGDFRRDGHYPRQLLSLGGLLELRVPELECRCGGHVSLSYSALEKYSRIGGDVAQRVRQRVSQGASLREVQAELEEQLATPLGLKTLNQRVLEFRAAVGSIERTMVEDCPPVVVVDGVWATWMVAVGESQRDRKGRLRQRKRKQKVVILVALAIWPDREEWDIVGWYLAAKEDEASWTAFLSQLQEAGLTQEKGLRLLIADGAGGIEAAHQMVYGAKLPLQRCVFHKIRSVLGDTSSPEGLSRGEGREQKRKLAAEVAGIWQAESEAEACRRMAAVVANYQSEQPRAMATLERDFGATVLFYGVQREAALEGKQWPARLLRTSSHLERANREIRRAIRRGCAWPSEPGLGVRVWLGVLGYRRKSKSRNSSVVSKVAEEALSGAQSISP